MESTAPNSSIWFARLAKWCPIIALVAVIHGLAAQGCFEVAFFDSGQIDFESYYYALQTYREGGNPYDDRLLTAAAGHTVYPFIYPHHTLAFFSLFDRGDIVTSKQWFLAAKVVALIVLGVLWTFAFVRHGGRGWFLVFAALGFNATLARDLTQGNVCAFEQLLIWFGLWALLNGWPGLFCAGVILGAQFKVQPLALLGLLWCFPVVQRARYAIASAVVVLLIAAAVVLHDPTAARYYVKRSSDVARAEIGKNNPCAPALWRELAGMAMDPYSAFDDVNRRVTGNVAYVPYAMLILFAAWRMLPRVGLGRRGVYLGILTFALTAPRMKDYSWNLVLVPAFELLRDALRRPMGLRVAVLIAFGLCALPLRDAMWTYRAYWLTFMLWAATLAAAGSGDTELSPHGEKADI